MRTRRNSGARLSDQYARALLGQKEAMAALASSGPAPMTGAASPRNPGREPSAQAPRSHSISKVCRGDDSPKVCQIVSQNLFKISNIPIESIG